MGAQGADGRVAGAVRRDRGQLPSRAQVRRDPGGRARDEDAFGPTRLHPSATGGGLRAEPDPGRARPLPRRRGAVQATSVRELHHRSWRHDFAHRRRGAQPRHPFDRGAALRPSPDPRERTRHRGRHPGRRDHRPRPAGAGGIPAAPAPVRPGAAETQTPEAHARRHSRRRFDRAARQYRAARRRGGSQGERCDRHRAFPQRVPVPQPQRPARRGRAVRGLPQSSSGNGRHAGHHPHLRSRRGQIHPRPAAHRYHSGAGIARDPVVPDGAAALSHPVACPAACLPPREDQHPDSDDRHRLRGGPGARPDPASEAEPG